ncbi:MULTISPECIES: hypothetical protein [Streptomyces]|uniref:UL36 very large tegument protein n=2 Tax=Streptomyces venezuelae TaxID=54571 RepID=F2RDF7_STRVP|nr:hypothetical protein [Streptomyces venezuelae]APE24926.1 UL36 very large tegument protein [Streptomyces venezuelae]QES02271.1 UL36 very large tegument protein [Streptomyces venezuelae ATCC 10712]CCA59449.1 UL36 very large tegument protein [Streptomyces venezuelae ATCC 10712]
MTVYQIPGEVAAFSRWLTELARRLPAEGGWYALFAERDPEGMRACFDGAEILPWDVVASLLQDAGEPADGPLAARGRTLYAAAARAHDRRPGGAAALAERRALMERELGHAETRARELTARLGAAPPPDPEERARLEHQLAWTRDDRERASSRVTDLTTRLAGLSTLPRRGEPEGAGQARVGPEPAAGAGEAMAPASASGHAASAAGAPRQETAALTPAPVRDVAARAGRSGKVRGRARGARYAWVEDGDDGQGAAPVPAPVPVLPGGAAAPRGARFGGAGESGRGTAEGREAGPAGPAGPFDPAEAARCAVNAVYALRRLRAQGRSGEAHGLLCEALAGPLARLPALAEELHRAGLGADWSVLLWEAASLPPARLAAVAGVLADAGRAADCEQLLRQGVARPVEEVAGACAALRAEGHHREARGLLAAVVRVRVPEDAARLAAVDPRVFVPQLLEAARAVSAARERDLLHALRVAGLAGV